ncbi:MAG: GMP synthase (glutamine-hydrolyzing) [Candidatus Omnitrophica bacterium 4484_213]|nr:MAG: GMP synthase (glutamine-hydrolyzing) [Candidatus Omnitrophica bacterium 4484_213]
MRKDWIAILDFGSQYTHLIARRIREIGVYSEIVPYNIKARDLLVKGPKGIVLSGGPASIVSTKSPICDKKILSIGTPVLGVCYGAQLIAKLSGGVVVEARDREYGKTYLAIKSKAGLFKGLSSKEIVWMSHGDKIAKLPPGFKITGSTDNAKIAAMEDKKGKLYGVQFHPEVVHTPKGKVILRNFIINIAGCKRSWNMHSFVETSVEALREEIGNEKVLCALSGGIDSSVLTKLLHKAIGKNLIAVFIDNGLLRKDEAELVRKRFGRYYHINLRFISARDIFLKRLKGVTNPEKKRKIIGKLFIEVFEKEAKKLGRIKFLAQGTLYPDVIESRSATGGPSATIKTHHNVGGLPQHLKFKLIEPLKDLFKDEVRLVGKELGLPDEIINRHPFPGPGLAVRIIGAITEEKLDVLREADWILIDEIKKAKLYQKLWQSFCVLLPVKTIGVMGDERTYENVVAVRAVTSDDAMTAHWAKLPYELLERVSNRIINEGKGINRVVYDISSKPPSTIEWE